MLNKKQLEDARDCKGYCMHCSIFRVQGRCPVLAAKTALAYEDMLKKAHSIMITLGAAIIEGDPERIALKWAEMAKVCREIGEMLKEAGE